MKSFCVVLVLFALCVLTCSVRAEGPAPAPAPKKAFDWGGDLRLRSENFDAIPIRVDPPGVTRGGKNVYFRGRTRIWGQYTFSDFVLFKARIVNEFRSYENGRGTNSYDWPDEWVFDNLYFDLKNVVQDKLDIRIGRQDLIYGNGRVILEGNPLDGSRTIYFNAVKASWKVEKNTVADILGIWNKAIDELAINSQDRDLVGLLGKFPTDMVESGGGVYVKNASIQKMPLEAYYLFKNESDYEWTDAQGVVQSQPDDLNLHTLGFRLMPKFTGTLTGNLEAAGQLGERGDQDVSGWMVDAKLSQDIPTSGTVKPTASLGFYYLSGDEPGTADDEGWNPLWARYPQQSELYVYAWDAEGAGRWSNMSFPYAGLDVAFGKRVTLNLLGGWMMAPEDNGPGGGDGRGALYTAWLKFKINDTWSGHLLGEFLDPGDYYKVEDTAYFARLEFSCVF